MRDSERLNWLSRRGATAAVLLVVVGCTSAQSAATPPPITPAPSASSFAIESAGATGTSGPRRGYLGGSLTWNAADANGGSTVSGHIELVLHDVGGHLWLAERGSGSTYAYDGQFNDCSPKGHLSGVVESGVGGEMEPEWHIGITNVSNTDIAPTADLGVSIAFYDEWNVICPGPPAYPAVASLPVLNFPGCTEATSVTMKNDGNGSYAVSCDVAIPNLQMTGHILGELHPIEGP